MRNIRNSVCLGLSVQTYKHIISSLYYFLCSLYFVLLLIHIIIRHIKMCSTVRIIYYSRIYGFSLFIFFNVLIPQPIIFLSVNKLSFILYLKKITVHLPY